MSFLEEYTLLEELGQGGYASIYKVRHNRLGYIRALRVLNTIISNGENDDTYQKFLEECKILLRLGNGNHSNIIHIYQPLLRSQRAIVEMDYVDGDDLVHYMQKRKFFTPVEDVIKLLYDISSALAYCHVNIYNYCMNTKEDNIPNSPLDSSKVFINIEKRRQLIEKYRIIHNDIHSGNIMRRRDGTYVLLDFGLAVEGNSVIRSSKHRNGAPEFKSPEKWNDEKILTTQSDIYSFGVVMYEFLTGSLPFAIDRDDPNINRAIYLMGEAHRRLPPPSIFERRKLAFERAHRNTKAKYESPDYPQWLEEIILKCLAKDPKERFENGLELHKCVKEHITRLSDIEYTALQCEKERLERQLYNAKGRIKNQLVIKEALKAEKEKVNQLTTEKEELSSLLEDCNSKVTALQRELKLMQAGRDAETTRQRKAVHWWMFLSILFFITTIILAYLAFSHLLHL